MSKLSFVIWSVALSLPVQYLFLLIPLLYEFLTVGEFGCTNYHESGLEPCSLGAMLANPILGIAIANALSFGLFSLFFVGASAILLAIGRALCRQVFVTTTRTKDTRSRVAARERNY